MPRLNRAFHVTVLTILGGIAACWPSMRSLTDYWLNHEYLSDLHGYFIVAISAWLVWRARADIEAAGLAPSWPFVIVTALLSVAWYLAWISGVELAYEMLLVLILAAAVAGAVGVRAVRAVGFGIGYLCFAMPAWSYLRDPLLSLSADGVTALTRMTGLPAYVEGNTVHIPAGSLEISGGCSGLNFFITALAISALYGSLNRYRLLHRFLLLAIAAVMAIFMNWVRIYGIILNAHTTDMKGYLVAVDHLTYGWVLFGVLLMVFFWTAQKIEPPCEPVTVTTPVVALAGVRVPSAFIAVLAALAIGPALTVVAEGRVDERAGTAVALPGGSQGWVGPGVARDAWSPAFPQADAEALGEYVRTGVRVAAYVNAYAYQAQGHEMIGRANSVLGSSAWQVEGERRVMPRAQGADFPYVEVTALAPDKERWVVAYVYTVGGRFFAGPLAAKLYYGVSVLMGDPWSGVVAAAAECAVDCDQARAAVNRFISDNGSRLAEVISSGRAGT